MIPEMIMIMTPTTMFHWTGAKLFRKWSGAAMEGKVWPMGTKIESDPKYPPIRNKRPLRSNSASTGPNSPKIMSKLPIRTNLVSIQWNIALSWNIIANSKYTLSNLKAYSRIVL